MGVDGGGWGWDLDCILSNSILPIFQVTYRAVCGSEVIVSVSVVHLEWGRAQSWWRKGGGGGGDCIGGFKSQNKMSR